MICYNRMVVLIKLINIYNNFNDSNKGMEAMQRLMHIDLNYLDLVINDTNIKNNIIQNCINLYNPDEVRYINNKYFVDYPLDLNRI